MTWLVLLLAGAAEGAVLSAAQAHVLRRALPGLSGRDGSRLSIGTAQWWVLRSHAPRAHRWIAATAAAWLSGLAVFSAIAKPLWRPGQPPALIAFIGVSAGIVMAGTVAAGTGWALSRLLHAR